MTVFESRALWCKIALINVVFHVHFKYSNLFSTNKARGFASAWVNKYLAHTANKNFWHVSGHLSQMSVSTHFQWSWNSTAKWAHYDAKVPHSSFVLNVNHFRAEKRTVGVSELLFMNFCHTVKFFGKIWNDNIWKLCNWIYKQKCMQKHYIV